MILSGSKGAWRGQSKGTLGGWELGECGCRCSRSSLGAGGNISLSLQYGACGQVRLHATISSANALFPKSQSPKVVHLSSQIYSSVLSNSQFLPNHPLLAPGEPSCPFCVCSAPPWQAPIPPPSPPAPLPGGSLSSSSSWSCFPLRCRTL